MESAVLLPTCGMHITKQSRASWKTRLAEAADAELKSLEILPHHFSKSLKIISEKKNYFFICKQFVTPGCCTVAMTK